MDSGGIYIHIPFCRQACRYCDFFFSVSLKYQDEYVDMLVKEIESKAERQANLEMNSLYLGGGTPSLLSEGNLMRIMETVRRKYHFTEDAEVTLECNPDDLDKPYVEALRKAGVNRLSIGVQSFRDRDLELMRRTHNASQAFRAIEEAFRAGFENLTIDLIYGIPGQKTGDWGKNLEQAAVLPIGHLSAYHLTFEPRTVFEYWHRKGKISPVSDETSEKMYRLLRERMKAIGFEHYEISNFAGEGRRSRHNQRYWSGEPYLGFGPSAHSFDGTSRSWNKPSLKDYLRTTLEGKTASESEILSGRDMYHDALILSLRTSRGISHEEIFQRFGQGTAAHFSEKAASFLHSGDLVEKEGRIIIEPGKWLMADHIIRELFLD